MSVYNWSSPVDRFRTNRRNPVDKQIMLGVRNGRFGDSYGVLRHWSWMVDAAVLNLSLNASSTSWQYMVTLKFRLATRLAGLWFSISAQNGLATR